MRFRLSLPLLQSITLLLVLWAPWVPHGHEVVRSNGRAYSGSPLSVTPYASEWAYGINLPALAVVAPVEFAIRRQEQLPSTRVRFYGLWLVGLLCWYMLGRFLDDVRWWRQNRALPPKNWRDLTFAFLAFPSALLLGTAFLASFNEERFLASWGIVWIAIASLALAFRSWQSFQQWPRRHAA